MRLDKRALVSLPLVVAVVFGAQWIAAATADDIALYRGKDRQAKLEEGAKREGEIAWYTTLSAEDSAKVQQLFEKRYPFVKVKLIRLTSERLVQRYMSEFQASRFLADVIGSRAPLVVHGDFAGSRVDVGHGEHVPDARATGRCSRVALERLIGGMDRDDYRQPTLTLQIDKHGLELGLGARA